MATTRLIKVVTEIGERLNVSSARDPEIEELAQDVCPEEVLERIEQRGRNRRGASATLRSAHQMMHGCAAVRLLATPVELR